MLDQGFLALTIFYPMHAHNADPVSAYLHAADRAFAEIASASAAENIVSKLRGAPAASGFKRLAWCAIGKIEETLVICAEANPQVGVGHAMRCMALAQVWNANQGRCVFFGGIEAGSLPERLIADGCELFESRPGPGDTVRRLNDMGISKAWVVLDGYHFCPEWQDVLVDSGFEVLCIDDGARLPRYRAQVIVSPDCDASVL